MIAKLQKGSGDVLVSLCIQKVSIKGMTLKICSTVHCSDLPEDTFASGEFQCSIYLQEVGEKCVLVFLEGVSIILKYTFTSVVHQLTLKSKDLSTNYSKS